MVGAQRQRACSPWRWLRLLGALPFRKWSLGASAGLGAQSAQHSKAKHSAQPGFAFKGAWTTVLARGLLQRLPEELGLHSATQGDLQWTAQGSPSREDATAL